mmetsp:Transcript_9142/g.19295  ORF Transcript_9142/g.19295 Transcript_9142/m.19295 type:complete len:279 (+) Transcript_9142:2320-3156(+)
MPTSSSSSSCLSETLPFFVLVSPLFILLLGASTRVTPVSSSVKSSTCVLSLYLLSLDEQRRGRIGLSVLVACTCKYSEASSSESTTVSSSSSSNSKSSIFLFADFFIFCCCFLRGFFVAASSSPTKDSAASVAASASSAALTKEFISEDDLESTDLPIESDFCLDENLFFSNGLTFPFFLFSGALSSLLVRASVDKTFLRLDTKVGEIFFFLLAQAEEKTSFLAPSRIALSSEESSSIFPTLLLMMVLFFLHLCLGLDLNVSSLAFTMSDSLSWYAFS